VATYTVSFTRASTGPVTFTLSVFYHSILKSSHTAVCASTSVRKGRWGVAGFLVVYAAMVLGFPSKIIWAVEWRGRGWMSDECRRDPFEEVRSLRVCSGLLRCVCAASLAQWRNGSQMRRSSLAMRLCRPKIAVRRYLSIK